MIFISCFSKAFQVVVVFYFFDPLLMVRFSVKHFGIFDLKGAIQITFYLLTPCCAAGWEVNKNYHHLLLSHTVELESHPNLLFVTQYLKSEILAVQPTPQVDSSCVENPC